MKVSIYSAQLTYISMARYIKHRALPSFFFKKTLSGPGSDREIIRILSKQLYLGTDDRLHFASFRASDSSFEGTVVTGLVDLVE